MQLYNVAVKRVVDDVEAMGTAAAKFRLEDLMEAMVRTANTVCCVGARVAALLDPLELRVTAGLQRVRSSPRLARL